MLRNKSILSIILATSILTIAGCGLSEVKKTPPKLPFNLIFKYGIGMKNELNTFEGTYTKDMIMNPSITIDFSLSDEELNKIYKRMIKMDFF